MTDLTTMVWKEITEFVGHKRSTRLFLIVGVALGILPALTFAHHHGTAGDSPVGMALRVMYVLFATVVMVAQTAPDLVLHERVGHTLDYLLTTRLPDAAIFGAKVLTAAAVGYVTALLAISVQLLAAGLIGGTGFHWMFLGAAAGRVVAFGLTAGLSLYVAVVGTFVALRVGEQRAAYLVTMLAVGLLTVPFVLGWLHLALTAAWLTRAALVFGAFSIVLGLLGVRWFRRDMLVLYLQE